jgi:alanine racemase
MKTHIEINAEHLIHNLKEFQKLTHKNLMFVVKANAYGHGLKEVVSIAKELDFIDYYAVDALEEAITVRCGDEAKKILIIGWADEDQLTTIIAREFEMVVPSMDYLKQVEAIAKKVGKRAKAHLKVETGTARMGMRPEEVKGIIEEAKLKNGVLNNDHVDFTGLYSHFANIEDTTDHSFAQSQLDIFNKLLDSIGSKADHLLKHFSCSASTLLFPKTHFDIARIGISAYGFWPSKPTYVSYIEKKKPAIQLKPVLSWYSKVAQVKILEKGESIGYGLTYRAFDRSRVIVVPVGYYDGYDRKLSNHATIIVNGVNAPVRGRVCMNMLMADVTHIPEIKQGDKVILIGSEGEESISADHLAEWAGSINYEIVSRINPLIPRRVV